MIWTQKDKNFLIFYFHEHGYKAPPSLELYIYGFKLCYYRLYLVVFRQNFDDVFVDLVMNLNFLH